MTTDARPVVRPAVPPMSVRGQSSLAGGGIAALIGIGVARMIVAANPALAPLEVPIAAALAGTCAAVGNAARNVGGKLGAILGWVG